MGSTSSTNPSSLHSSDEEVVTYIGPPPSMNTRTRLGLNLDLPLPATTPGPGVIPPNSPATPGRISRMMNFVRTTVAKRKNTAVAVLSPRRLREVDDEISETNDDGILFGVKRKHFRAQLNLSILTFGVTAVISILVLVFAGVMLALDRTNSETRTTYLMLLTSIVAAWLPSPTTLVKKDDKKK
jgi:hypothetical protein